MFDQLVLSVTGWLGGALGPAMLASFVWGLVSVLFSPCHMVSIPLVVGYVAGQGKLVRTREATGYAALFSLGLYLSILALGVACSLLGRMLGDVPQWWEGILGALLVWLGLDLMGLATCRLPGGHLQNFRMRGRIGAFVLGGSFGLLSGACTFGFIAPILAIITLQQRMAEGIVFIACFALGHCLPILVAGSSAAFSQQWAHGKGVQNVAHWGRKFSGFLVMGIGLFLIVSAFLESGH